MQARTRALTALALSFTAYAVPVASAHWVDFFGSALLHELFSDREARWLAADWTLGLAAQAALGMAAWLGLGWGRGAAAGALLATGLPLVYAVNVGYMVAIPSRFLIEADDTPEVTNLQEQCVASGAWLDPAPAGIARRIDQRGEALVQVGQTGTAYGMLRASDCRIEPLPLPELAIAPSVHQVLPDGSVVYAVVQRGVSGRTFWLLRRGAVEPRQLSPPAEADMSTARPTVAEDGSWAAWTARSSDHTARVLLQSLQSDQRAEFSHDLLQRTTLVPVELDMAARTLVINRDLATFAGLTLDGGVAWGPLHPGQLAAQENTMRYIDGQWLAWDAYVESRPKEAAWSTRDGEGRYRVPAGRDVTAGALHPAGRYVALSTATALNIGHIQDTVLVRRVRDGAELFRKALPAYTRSHVAFLGSDYFAYSDVVGTTATTHVLRLPSE